MMRRLSSVLAGAVLLATPLSSLATFTTPSELFAALQHTTPMHGDYELHGHFDQYYVAAWISGDADVSNPAWPTVSLKATVDFVTMQAKVRVKLHLRAVDGMGYLFIDSIDGKNDALLASLAGTLKGKKWLSFPVSQSMSVNDATDMFGSMDDIFHLQSWSSKGKHGYTLTLQQQVIDEVMMSLNSIVEQGMTEPSFTFQIDTQNDANDLIQWVKVNIGLNSSQASFSVKGTSTALAKLTVTAPADAVPIEEMTTMFDSWSVPAWLDHSDTSSMPSTDQSEEWQDSSSSASWSSSSEAPTFDDDCATNMSLVRGGFCGAKAPHKRNG